LEEKNPYTGKGRRKIILLQDNARPHTTTTLKMITNLDWEILSHPAYSPHFAPSDHFFRSLQHHLTDTHFTYVEKDVEKNMVEFINSKQPSFSEVKFGRFPKDGANV